MGLPDIIGVLSRGFLKNRRKIQPLNDLLVDHPDNKDKKYKDTCDVDLEPDAPDSFLDLD